jgi:translation initiation factor eIF-2B subunit alpha/methylthioribose-1-phosphate isomerase
LTSWELKNEGIDHSIVVDTSAGYLMSRGEVDLIIVGADRVARNGDIANKIGTLEKAVLAKEYDIPFYVAFPSTTFDPLCESGKDILIEIRDQDEVLSFNGNRSSPQDVNGYNPAFDVTPARFITGYITDIGNLKVGQLKQLNKKKRRVARERATRLY